MNSIKKDFRMNYSIYLLFIPVALHFLIFEYTPLLGNIIAFQRYVPSRGIWNSNWVGFDHFVNLFSGVYFKRIITNTLLISIFSLLAEFTTALLLALFLNEVRKDFFKKVVQTVTYIPRFVSLVVICGIVVDFTNRNGLINDIFSSMGFERVSYLQKPEYFKLIFVSSGVWQFIGWNSIIFLAALSSLDPQLFEAATIDGASRFKQILYITIPSILPMVAVLLILRIGNLFNVGFEKVLLLQNNANISASDIISTYVYRRGLLNSDYSFATAVGMFNGLLNLLMLITANYYGKKLAKTSIY